MIRAISILLVSQLVCGFGFFRPRHTTGERYIQMSGFPEANWENDGGVAGVFQWAEESNKTFTRCSGRAEYARVWIHTTNNTCWITQIREQNTNSFSYVAETSWLPTPGTNVVPLNFTLEEGDATAFFLSDATVKVTFSSGGAAGGIPTRSTNSHMAAGTWVYPSTTTGVALNYGLCGKGPALAGAFDSNGGGYPGSFSWVESQRLPGVATNCWTHMLRNRMGFRAHMVNYGVGGYTTHQIHEIEMPLVTNDRPRVLLYQGGGNNVLHGTNTWDQMAQKLGQILAMHNGPKYVMGMFPGNVFSDAQALTIRQWNTNAEVFCRANGAFFIPVTSLIGTNRVSTGQLDDIKPEFNFDGAHLTWLGKKAVVEYLAPILSLHLQ